MDSPPLTASEKRFILAEVIKASSVSVEALAAFIHANNTPANLMDMQLPRGCNMKQCLQLLNQLGVPASLRPSPPALNNLGGGSQSSPPRSHTSKTPSPPKRPPLAYIAPRPPNGAPEGHGFDHGDASSRDTRRVPKKRGRPSKADMAKRDLKPVLPQLIAPRPSPSQFISPFQPILPATRRAHEKGRSTSPAATSSTSHSTPSDDSRSVKKRRRITNSTA